VPFENSPVDRAVIAGRALGSDGESITQFRSAQTDGAVR
jgi:hypothetical protein